MKTIDYYQMKNLVKKLEVSRKIKPLDKLIAKTDPNIVSEDGET